MMKVLFLWIGLIVAATPAVADEVALRETLKTEAAQLLEQGNIAAFDQRASELRRTRQLTPAGQWQLYYFYKGVERLPQDLPDAAIWGQVEAATESYLEARPDSPSAVMARARVLVAHAWAYRSGGYTNELSNRQKSGFAQWMERARDVLDSNRAVGCRDPDWYVERIAVLNGQGDDKESVLTVAREALALEPTYEPILSVTSTALLPKWGGSGALERRFVALAASSTAAQQGRQTYGRIMFAIADLNPNPIAELDHVRVQWPELKESLAAISAAYPDPWNFNAERAMACLVGTQADFESAAARVGAGILSVSWFDKFNRWSDCEARQRGERGSATRSFSEAVAGSTVSAQLIAVVTGAIMLGLLTLRGMRRTAEIAGTDLNPAALPSTANPTEVPIVYRLTSAALVSQTLSCSILVLVGLTGVWACGMAFELRDSPPGLVMAFISALLMTAAALSIVNAYQSELRLYKNYLEIHELWRVRRISRKDIKSRQMVGRSGANRLVLTLNAEGRILVRLPQGFGFDTRFQEWFGSIPDTDKVAAEALEAAVRDDPRLGSTPEDRIGRLQQARTCARYMGIGGAALFFWSVYFPHPLNILLSLLAAVPWLCIGMMVAMPGVYQIGGTKMGPGPRPDLTAALLGTGAAFALRAFVDLNFLDISTLLYWTAAGALVFALALLRVSAPAPDRKAATFFLILLISAGNGYGAVSFANCLFDRSATTEYQTKILRKRVTGSRSRSYTLTLDRWGNRDASGDVRVPGTFYSEVQVGQSVCVDARSGSLGLRGTPLPNVRIRSRSCRSWLHYPHIWQISLWTSRGDPALIPTRSDTCAT